MKYWFVYKLADGAIHSPYIGEADEWTNIPDGCGVIGPFSQEHATANDAYINSDCYKVVNGELQPVPDIDAIKAAREEAMRNPVKTPEQKEMDKLKNENLQLNNQIIDLWETLLNSGVL